MAFDTSANIGIRIFVDDAASRILFGVNQQLGQIGQFARGAGLGFGQMSAQMAQMAAMGGLLSSFILFGSVVAVSAKNAVELETVLAQIQNATNLTSGDMTKLRDILLTLGGSSIFSIQQLADGIVLLGQYGFKTVDQINLLSQAGVNLAEATNTLPNVAFKLLASTMQAFLIPASQATQTADLLFYSFEHGTPNVSQLQLGFAQVAGTADVLHVSLADLIPAFDILSPMMGGASQVGTSLRYALNSLLSPTATQAAEQQKLGLSFQDSTGHFIGFQAAVEELHTKLAGLSPAAQLQALTALFTVRGSNAMKDLLSQFDLYQQGVAKLKASNDAAGQSQQGANRIMETANAQWTAFKTNVSDILALIGMNFLPVLKPLISNFLQLSQVVREFVSGPGGQAVAVFLLLGTALSGVGFLVVLAIITPFAGMVGIMLGVVAAVSLVAAGITLLIANFHAIADAVGRVKPVLEAVGVALLTVAGIIAAIKFDQLWLSFMQAIPALIQFSVALVTQTIPAMIAYAGRLAMAIADLIVFAATNAGILIPVLFQAAAAWLIEAAASMLAIAPYILLGAVVVGAVVGLGLLIAKLGILNVIISIAKAAWQAILPAIQQAGDAIRGAFMQALTQLQPIWNQLVAAFNQARPLLMMLGAVLGGLIVIAIALLIGSLRMLISIFANVVVTVIQVVSHVIQVFTGLIQFFTGLFKIIFGIFTLNGNLIKAGWDLLWHGILNIVQGIAGGIWAVFTGFFRTVLGGIQNFINGIIQFFIGLWNRLVGHSIVPDMLAQIVLFFLGLPARVFGALVTLAGGLWNIFLHAGQQALTAITQKANDLLSFMHGLPGRIVGVVGNLGNLLWSAGVSIIQGLWNGAKSVIGGLFNWFGQQLGNLRNMFPHSPVKEGPLRGYENWMPTMIRTMASSAEQAGPSLRSSMSRVAGGIQQGILSSTVPGGGSVGAGGTQFIIQLDGKVIYDSNMKYMRNTLTAQGMPRLLK